ncbi:MAG TPA: CDGSH iron-sulfur domain-containing protein [Stellaceae bacterium]|nr:CDGSH iron-sulfur domain-containing protein [Stellaceae bacterium]
MASQPIIAGREPATVEVKQGKTYLWCSCGRSRTQPMCDGSHVGTGLTPLEFKPPWDKKVRLCMCKQTKTPPYCDGSHLDLP